MICDWKIYGLDEFERQYTYNGKLGAIYSEEKTEFLIWAPVATKVRLGLYGKNGRDFENKVQRFYEMNRMENGVWSITLNEDLDGEFYNYFVTNNLREHELVDPYAKAVGVNGNRGMVINLERTNPEGWDEHKIPILENQLDSIIYEANIRDLTINEGSGVDVDKRGKYLGMCQMGTRMPRSNVKTGIDHLIELGINVLHLLPTFDFKSVNEETCKEYNWGYDPQNFNVPEGSYSSDPYSGDVRIKEFKQMIMNFHNAGIKVVMDVVYNHTFDSEMSNLNKAVPYYYYRQNKWGDFSNGSGCGNELASERSMVRKLMVDSILYWATEYKIDGFRFDLMAVHDIETMKIIREKLNKIDNSILMYGEGWNGGESSLEKEKSVLKNNMPKFEKLQIAAFSDDIRDAIKGHVFEKDKPGFISGANDLEETIKFGIVAATYHSDIDYDKILYTNKPWANEPYQTVTYASAHDNYTLWDKISLSNFTAIRSERIQMNKLAAAIVMTSQGISFMHSGDELLRTKALKDGTLIENSYNCPDSVNNIQWSRKEKFIDVFNYYKGLIQLKKEHKAFRMRSADDIRNNLQFMKQGVHFNAKNVVAYKINAKNIGDSWNEIVVILNGSGEEVEVDLKESSWNVVVNSEKAGIIPLSHIEGDKIVVQSRSCYVLVDSKSF